MLTLIVVATLWPKTMATSIANVSIDKWESLNKCWRDGNSGYYLLTTNDCDGGHRSMTLTKDRRNIGEAGYDTTRFGRKPKYEPIAEIGKKTLPLSAANGIRIGMTRAQVRAQLGRPSRTASRGKAGEFWCAMYKKVRMEDKESGQVLRNTYIFKNGKLIEIIVNLDSVPGCGEDSLSDEGWPWTNF